MRKLLRRYLGLLVAIIIFAPAGTLAASIDTGNGDFTLNSNQTRLGNLYVMHGQSTIAGHVTGDVVVAGGNVTITGPVDKSIIILGGKVDIRGAVGESVRALAGQLTISSSVAQDLLIGSGQVTLAQGASIGGDVIVASGKFDLQGRVSGDVRLYSGDATLEGSVGGSVYAIVNHLRITESARIGRDLSYTARQEADMAPSAKIGGKIAFTKSSQSFYSSVSAAGIIFKLLMLAVAVLVILAIFPAASVRTAEEVNRRFLRNFIVGFLFLIIAPVVIFLVFLTIVGIYLATLLLGIYLLLLGFGFIGAALSLGYVVVRRLGDGDMNLYLTGLLGVALLVLLSAIPILGGVAVFILFCASIGALLHGMRSGTVAMESEAATIGPAKPKRVVRKPARKP